MPMAVAAAYRDPIDCVGLLGSDMFLREDRVEILDALTKQLISMYGDVWIASGGREARLSTRLKRFTTNVGAAVRILHGIDEYGGEEGVNSLLCQLIQPRWAQWWESFQWAAWDDVVEWRSISSMVLGHRQFVWLAAQYARTVVHMTAADDRDFFIDAIESAERWAISPTVANRDMASDIFSEASEISSSLFEEEGSLYQASLSAAKAVQTVQSQYVIASAAASAAWAAADASTVIGSTPRIPQGFVRTASVYALSMRDLAELTRRLIQPTIIAASMR